MESISFGGEVDFGALEVSDAVLEGLDLVRVGGSFGEEGGFVGGGEGGEGVLEEARLGGEEGFVEGVLGSKSCGRRERKGTNVDASVSVHSFGRRKIRKRVPSPSSITS